MISISDYIIMRLKQCGVKHIFGLIGSGTAVQLFDSIGRTDGIEIICTLHEQSAGMAATAYAAVTGNIGVCITDSGPGAANVFTAIAGAYYNSLPTMFIMAQPQTYMQRFGEELRHYSYHENDIIGDFKAVAKYVALINRKEDAIKELEKGLSIMKSGRPGPVVLAIADDITWQEIEIEKKRDSEIVGTNIIKANEDCVEQCFSMMKIARRPILFYGGGIQSIRNEAFSFAKLLDWPVALTWAVRDLLDDSDPQNVGSIGNQGSRSGNFALQSSDFILSIGVRLDPFVIGSDPQKFAQYARKVSVDIDRAELDKYSIYGIPCDLPIYSDAGIFIKTLTEKILGEKDMEDFHFKGISQWCKTIDGWKKKYPLLKKCEEYKSRTVDPYCFISALSELTNCNDVIMADTGSSRNFLFQAFQIKKGQRLISWLNYACLGYGIPGAIGAAFAHNRERVIVVMGDGGLQFNIQELATIMYHKLDVKIFVLDNDGYASVEQTQNAWLNGRHIGTNRDNGVPLPNSSKIATAYGFEVIEVDRNENVLESVRATLDQPGPSLCIIKIPITSWTSPIRKGADGLEDMTPKLSSCELHSEMKKALDPDMGGVILIVGYAPYVRGRGGVHYA